MTRPRAADDFAVIRARIEELPGRACQRQQNRRRARFHRGRITRRAL